MEGAKIVLAVIWKMGWLWIPALATVVICETKWGGKQIQKLERFF